MSGKSLTDKMDLLRFCQKGLFDFDGGNQRKNSPAAPISHFQRIFNVSTSASGHSSSCDKEMQICPQMIFVFFLYAFGFLPEGKFSFYKDFPFIRMNRFIPPPPKHSTKFWNWLLELVILCHFHDQG